ncbi:MAG TPA: hypothetical protein VNR38_07090 [Ureibacillus sp.]|nr:hypothetical protein [Ureibacillus sp.]
MKKICFTFLIFNLFIISGCSNDYKYQPGKDTVEIYGDGTYQILSGNTNTLANVETQENPEEIVFKYKDEKPLVFVIGESGYTILNYQTGEIKKYKKMNEIPTKQRKVLYLAIKKCYKRQYLFLKCKKSQNTQVLHKNLHILTLFNLIIYCVKASVSLIRISLIVHSKRNLETEDFYEN